MPSAGTGRQAPRGSNQTRQTAVGFAGALFHGRGEFLRMRQRKTSWLVTKALRALPALALTATGRLPKVLPMIE
jgi:hypothetical protein